jgi:hypothetical protein
MAEYAPEFKAGSMAEDVDYAIKLNRATSNGPHHVLKVYEDREPDRPFIVVDVDLYDAATKDWETRSWMPTGYLYSVVLTLAEAVREFKPFGDGFPEGTTLKVQKYRNGEKLAYRVTVKDDEGREHVKDSGMKGTITTFDWGSMANGSSSTPTQSATKQQLRNRWATDTPQKVVEYFTAQAAAAYVNVASNRPELELPPDNPQAINARAFTMIGLSRDNGVDLAALVGDVEPEPEALPDSGVTDDDIPF